MKLFIFNLTSLCRTIEGRLQQLYEYFAYCLAYA